MIRQTLSPEFKHEAVRMLEQGDKEGSQLARELGVKRNQLRSKGVKSPFDDLNFSFGYNF